MTRKVAVAESKADAHGNAADQARSPRTGAVAAAGSIGATCSTVVIGFPEPSNRWI